MARGPHWRCTEMQVIRANLDKTDAEIAALLPGRKTKSVEDFRRKYGIPKGWAQRRDRVGRFVPGRASA